MKTLLYIHGFASSGATGSATNMRTSLYPQDVRVVAPDVPVSPAEALPFLRRTVDELKPDIIVATSMGAMYAEQLRGSLRVLVNPSFAMARLLTFGGLGRKAFRNPRQDGQKDFKVDKQMIQEFRNIEANNFKGITAEDKQLVYGLFGDHDSRVNCQAEFKKHYGTEHFALFDGDHYLNDAVLHHTVLPLVRKLLGING